LEATVHRVVGESIASNTKLHESANRFCQPAGWKLANGRIVWLASAQRAQRFHPSGLHFAKNDPLPCGLFGLWFTALLPVTQSDKMIKVIC
jgi:hypothetical protein